MEAICSAGAGGGGGGGHVQGYGVYEFVHRQHDTSFDHWQVLTAQIQRSGRAYEICEDLICANLIAHRCYRRTHTVSHAGYCSSISHGNSPCTGLVDICGEIVCAEWMAHHLPLSRCEESR